MTRREKKEEADENKSKSLMLRLQTVPTIAHLEDYFHIWLQCWGKKKSEKDYSIIAITDTSVQVRSAF